MPILRLIFVMVILSAIFLCISWQESRIRYETRRLQVLMAMLDNRQAEVQNLKAQVARLKSPQRIMLIVEELGMELILPQHTPLPFKHGLASIRHGEMAGFFEYDVKGETE